MIDLIENTPIEKYDGIYVKREDLCGGEGAPTFSKIRGIVAHLRKLKKQGITTVGYTETSISMAGWGVAWACKHLSMKAVIFEPVYTTEPDHLSVLKKHKAYWIQYGADIIELKAGMAKVNWYISKNVLEEQYGNKAVLLPLGLPFVETIEATANVAKNAIKSCKVTHIVVNIGSGTICAGILRGLYNEGWYGYLWGIMGRSGDIPQKRKVIDKKSGMLQGGLFGKTSVLCNIVDPGWEYTQKSEVDCPFPCHEYYDLKAWQWLTENRSHLGGDILFWNIGH